MCESGASEMQMSDGLATTRMGRCATDFFRPTRVGEWIAFAKNLVKTTIVAIVLLAWYGPAPAAADVRNETGRFDTIVPCEAYLAFLRFDESTGFATNCHRHESFIITEGETKSAAQFLERLKAEYGADSYMGKMADVHLAMLYGDPKKTYELAASASLLMVYSMTRAADAERAFYYGRLLQGIQRLSLKEICVVGDSCQGFPEELLISDVLGPQFQEFDGIRKDIALYCSLRSDAFVVPIREVVGSAAFGGCVEGILSQTE